jgi:hypothetical protein
VVSFGAESRGERVDALGLAEFVTGGEQSTAGAAPLSGVPDGRGPPVGAWDPPVLLLGPSWAEPRCRAALTRVRARASRAAVVVWASPK